MLLREPLDAGETASPGCVYSIGEVRDLPGPGPTTRFPV